MTTGDDERRLEEALRAVGDDYLRRHPPDLAAARVRVGRLRRRRRLRLGGTYAVATAAAVAVAVLAWPGASVRDDELAPANRPGLPQGALTIAAGEGATGLAAGEDVIWVASPADATVTRVNPATNATAGTFNLLGEPRDLAVGADGEVWVATPDVGVVQRIDPAGSGQTPNVNVDVGGATAALDLAIDRFLWVSVVGDRLLQVDRETGEIVREIAGLQPVNVAARDGGVFVLGSDGVVRGVDPDTGTPNDFRMAFDVAGRGDVHYYEGRLWVADGAGRVLYSADVGSGSKLVRTYEFAGEYLEMVHVAEGVLVLSDLGGGTGLLSLIDPAAGNVTVLAEIDGSPRDLVRGDEDLWVSVPDADAVVRIPWPFPR